MIAVTLSEWEHANPGQTPKLRGFRLATQADRKAAQMLTEQRVLEFMPGEDGLALRSFAHVGRLEFDGLAVTVLPKLAPHAMLELLRYAYSLRDLRLMDQASFEAGAHGLQDLLIAQLQAEAHELIHRGLVYRYVRRDEELASPRGRIDIPRIARRANPAATRIPCVHYPRSSDFVLNQVIRGGVELASRLAVAPLLRRSTAQTAAKFADLASASPLTSALLQRASRSVDRLSSHYRPLLQLTDLLYNSSNFTLEDSVSAIRLKGFLFDMNRFFQALVGKFLTDALPEWRVIREDSLRGMMAYSRRHNPLRRRAPLPRPDFVVTRGRERYLLDAKYRDLWRHSLPREMLYQLAVYAMSQAPGSTAAILYPTDDRAATEAIIDIREPTTDAVRAHVALRPVVIPQLLALLADPTRYRREREHLAEKLVVGTSSS